VRFFNLNFVSLKQIIEFNFRHKQPKDACEFFFRHKDIFIDPFQMIKDPVFNQCGFTKPYFCIAAQRYDEMIFTFEKGLISLFKIILI
jgi:hypothetical protein